MLCYECINLKNILKFTVVEKLRMPNLLNFMQMMRNWRIDSGDYNQRVAPSTPIITVLPVVEDVEKIIIPEENIENIQDAKDNIVVSVFDTLWFTIVMKSIFIKLCWAIYLRI